MLACLSHQSTGKNKEAEQGVECLIKLMASKYSALQRPLGTHKSKERGAQCPYRPGFYLHFVCNIKNMGGLLAV